MRSINEHSREKVRPKSDAEEEAFPSTGAIVISGKEKAPQAWGCQRVSTIQQKINAAPAKRDLSVMKISGFTLRTASILVVMNVVWFLLTIGMGVDIQRGGPRMLVNWPHIRACSVPSCTESCLSSCPALSVQGQKGVKGEKIT